MTSSHAVPAGSDNHTAPPSRASITCDANSRTVFAAVGWMFRITKRDVLVSNSISIDAAALVAAASLRSSDKL